MTEQAKLRQIGGSHYKDLDVEPWDAMQAWMSSEEWHGFLLGNVIKYLARAGRKDIETEREDLLKAHHYLERLLEEV